MAGKDTFDGLEQLRSACPSIRNWILNPDSNGKQNYYQRHTRFPWYAVGNGDHRHLLEWRERLVAGEPVHNRPG